MVTHDIDEVHALEGRLLKMSRFRNI